MHSPVLPRRRGLLAALGFSLAAGMVAATPAAATFPGENGKLAFAQIVDGTVNDRELWTVNADGTELTQITTDGGQKDAPEWSPDGSKIIFNASGGGLLSGIYTVNPDGSGSTRLPSASGVVNPVYAPDGARFAGRNAPGTTLFIRDAATGGPIASYAVPGLRLVGLDWSPDGTKIAYVGSLREGTEVTGRGIGIFDVGAETFTLIRGGDGDLTPYRSPEWSADSQRIFFSQGDTSDIWSMNPDGTGATQLANPGNEDQPAPAPDGTRVAYNTTTNTFSGSLDLMDPDGSDREQTVAFGSAGALYDWQPIVESQLEPLTATKTANPSYTTIHRWDITKAPNRQVFYNHDKKHVAVDYTVKAKKKTGGVRDVAVNGVISINNPNDVSIPLGPITDALPGSTCAVGLSPASIAANATINIDYTCTFPNQVPADGLTNTATVSFGDGESAQATAPVNFTGAQVSNRHNAVKVIDRLGDGPTKVLAEKLTRSKNFTYRRYLKAPATPGCVYHPNTASVIGLTANGQMERSEGKLRILAEATAKVRVCQKAPAGNPSSEDPKPPTGSNGDTPKVIITPGSSNDPKGDKPKPRPAVVKPSSEDPGPVANRRAKLKVTKKAKAKHTRIGNKLVFTITVKNTGRKAATGVILRDRLPRQMRALKTSMPKKSTVGKRFVRVKMGTIRPGATKRVRIVAYAAARPTLNKAVKKKIALTRNSKVKAKLRYRARKGIVCNVAFAGAKNAKRSNLGVACVRVHKKAPQQPTEQ